MSISFPRVCGDVSETSSADHRNGPLSPRMRGCFYPAMSFPLEKTAFPAYAGMFPASCTRSAAGSRFPRVCGDVSIDKAKDITVLKLSPRMRGCFQNQLRKNRKAKAFPAYAGMFLASLGLESLPLSFPRVCGDVSTFAKCALRVTLFSPRMRGCFRCCPQCDSSWPKYLWKQS
mgnify:FL=1